jgi:hypothetical protein
VLVFERAGEVALDAGLAVSRTVVVSGLAGVGSALPALSTAIV